jgi:hypothetical protein
MGVVEVALTCYGAVKFDRGCRPPTEEVRIIILKTFSAILDLTREQLSSKQEKLTISLKGCPDRVENIFFMLSECGGGFMSAER